MTIDDTSAQQVTDHERSRAQDILEATPLFASLEPAARLAVVELLRPITILGGNRLFDQGDVGDALYIVASGCLGVFDVSGSSSPMLVAEVPAGQIVGEMALLGHRNRTFTVTALRDSELWRLDSVHLEHLVSRFPAILRCLTGMIVERVGREARHPTSYRPRSFAIVPLQPHAALREFSEELAKAMSSLGGTSIVLGPEAMGHSSDWYARCEAQSDKVIYLADGTMTSWSRLCLRQADCIVPVYDVNDRSLQPSPGQPSILQSYEPDPAFRPRCELVLLHTANGPEDRATSELISDRRVTRYHHVWSEAPADYRRLARVLTRRAIGLVLSGGGALGFAHIGVVKALREAHIEIDLVGGSSMGALVAAAIAARWSDEEIRVRFHRSFVERNPLCDYTIPFVSLFAGRRVTRLLIREFGEMQIEDLPLPFFCMSTNLSTRSSVVHRRGPLWEKLRASISIPGILPPAVIDGQAHIDGGVLANLPIRTMKSAAPGFVIGSSIDTTGGHDAGPDVLESWTPWTFFSRLVWRRSRTLPLPPIIRIPLRSALLAMDMNELEDRKFADILVLPPMPHYDFLDWTVFERAIAIGYQSAVSVLANRDKSSMDAFVAI